MLNKGAIDDSEVVMLVVKIDVVWLGKEDVSNRGAVVAVLDSFNWFTVVALNADEFGLVDNEPERVIEVDATLNKYFCAF